MNLPDIYRERLIYNELIIMLKGDATHAKEIKVRRWIDKEDGGEYIIKQFSIERESRMIERREVLPTSVLLEVELSHNGCSN